MTLIKVIYDNGQNGMVRVMRQAKRNNKRLHEMSSEEIVRTGFGMFR